MCVHGREWCQCGSFEVHEGQCFKTTQVNENNTPAVNEMYL